MGLTWDQSLKLLERRLSRLCDDHKNALPFQDTEALNAIDLQSKTSVSVAYEKLLSGTAWRLSEYCDKVKADVLQLIDGTVTDLSTDDRDAVLRVAATNFDSTLYLKRFDLFGEAIQRHFGRAGMTVNLDDYRLDLCRARLDAGTSNTIDRFFATLKDDLDLLIQRKQKIAADISLAASNQKPHWTAHWGFWVAVIAMITPVAATYLAFVNADAEPASKYMVEQETRGANVPTPTSQASSPASASK
jgi:hypothetical protein